MLQHGWFLPKNRTQLGQNSVQKFIKLICVSSWPFNLWVITWNYLPYFITNSNFYFQNPVTGLFNFHFVFHKANSNYVTNPILRFTTWTLEQLISVINHFNIPYFEFLQKNVNKKTLQCSNNFFWVPWQHSIIPGRKPKMYLCIRSIFSHSRARSLKFSCTYWRILSDTDQYQRYPQGNSR